MDSIIFPFDFEADGKDVDIAKIIQVYIQAPNGNAYEGEFVTIISLLSLYCFKSPTTLLFLIAFVNPGVAISKDITKLTGITNDDLAGAKTFAKIAQEMVDFIQRNKGDSGKVILAGFNARDYDIPLLTNELLRLGDQSRLAITDFGEKVLDVYHLAKNVNVWDDAGFDMPARHGLKDVYRALHGGNDPENLHTAGGDVIAMNAVIAKLDPHYSISLQDYTYSISYENVELDSLPLEERKTAKAAQSKLPMS